MEVHRTYYVGVHAFIDGRDAASREIRSFRLDRIVAGVTRMESGEIKSPLDWFLSTGPEYKPAGARGMAARKSSAKPNMWQNAVFFCWLSPYAKATT